MSSFIELIKKSGTDSLDVVMKNGRVYRYVEIAPDHLGYLLEAYEEKVTLEESIGRFYNENIKGIYEAIEVTELLEVRTDVDVEKAMATLKEGKALLIGDKEKLDELLKALAIKFHIKINREGIYKSYTLTSTPCLVFTGGNLTIVSQSQYRGNAIIPIGTLLLPQSHIVKDEGYFYEVELTKKGSQEAQNERLTDKEYKYQSEENKGLEDELKGQSEEEKNERENGSVTKQMALQSLEMIKTIAENSHYDIGLLAKIIEDYITKK